MCVFVHLIHMYVCLYTNIRMHLIHACAEADAESPAEGPATGPATEGRSQMPRGVHNIRR
jgi:hypothetical protein